MKNFLKKLIENDFTMPVIGTLFWMIILIVNCSIAWSDDPLTNKSFIRLLIPAVLLMINVLGLGECSKLRETKRVVDRLDVLAKVIFPETKKGADLENYKKILSSDELEKFKNIDIWEPCIFKPGIGEPGSHQCLDGLYNRSRHLFKLDPLFYVDKDRLLYTWKEDDVVEFTMKEVHINGR